MGPQFFIRLCYRRIDLRNARRIISVVNPKTGILNLGEANFNLRCAGCQAKPIYGFVCSCFPVASSSCAISECPLRVASMSAVSPVRL